MSFEDAINYPRQGDEAVKTILIGGVLGLLGFLVIPAILVIGFYLRTLRAAIAGDDEPPVFDEWGDLLVDGLKGFVIGLVYFVVPAAILMISVGGVAAAAIATGDVGLGTIAGAVTGFSVAFVLAVIAWYVLPAALANAVAADRVGAAFAFGDLKAVLLDGDYAVSWLLALGLVVAASILVGVLNLIPPLGFVAGAFVNFYVGVVAFYLYGRAFAGIERPEAGPEPTAGQSAA